MQFCKQTIKHEISALPQIKHRYATNRHGCMFRQVR